MRDTGEDSVGTGDAKDQLKAVQDELGGPWDPLVGREMGDREEQVLGLGTSGGGGRLRPWRHRAPLYTPQSCSRPNTCAGPGVDSNRVGCRVVTSEDGAGAEGTPPSARVTPIHSSGYTKAWQDLTCR